MSDESPRNRPTRIPFSANSQKMQVEYVDQDFFNAWVPHWFNDQRGRIERAQNAGYQFVDESEVIGLGGQDLHANNNEGSQVSMVVTGPVDGNPEVTAYLMKIKKEWYDEDQLTKLKKRQQGEAMIHEGQAGGVAVENVYGNVSAETRRYKPN